MERTNFSLIELLLVIGIIAILVSIVIVAINPTKQMGSARDAERQAHLDEILTAVYQYAVDHNGDFPPELLSDEKEICVYDMSCDGVVLSSLKEKYLSEVVRDPLADRDNGGTNYFISLGDDRRVTVTAPGAEKDPPLRMVR
ncbi:type II secretion system protein [Candidatus Peregrinibacteria bacterium]|nr:type II secretion system protein [Candidatus Peregrinibacteria bacterium]